MLLLSRENCYSITLIKKELVMAVVGGIEV